MQATYTNSAVDTFRIVLQPALNRIASVVHDILTTKTQQFHKSFSLQTVDNQYCQKCR